MVGAYLPVLLPACMCMQYVQASMTFAFPYMPSSVANHLEGFRVLGLTIDPNYHAGN